MATSEPPPKCFRDQVEWLVRVVSRDGALELLASLLSDKGRRDQGQMVKQQVEKGQLVKNLSLVVRLQVRRSIFQRRTPRHVSITRKSQKSRHGSCLFHALADQILSDPNLDGEVRKGIVDLMRKNRHLYAHCSPLNDTADNNRENITLYMDQDAQYDDHLQKLSHES
jgi:hypothetical protein